MTLNWSFERFLLTWARKMTAPWVHIGKHKSSKPYVCAHSVPLEFHQLSVQKPRVTTEVHEYTYVSAKNKYSSN